MLNDIDAIKQIKAFIEQHVASEYDPAAGRLALEKPRDDNKVDVSFELVKPAVFDGWIPPQGYLDDSGLYVIPGIVVMSDGGSDIIGNPAAAKIRLAFATYDYGTTEILESKLKTKYDSKGYYDLMNLMNLTRMKLATGDIATNRDFEWDMYQEQKYPYWHGWMTFTCPIVSSSEYIDI